MNQSSLTDLRRQLRQSMRLKRQSLTAGQQTQAAESIIPQALSLIESYQASHIAFYLPFNGEISPIPLMEQLLQQGKKLYLPLLHPFTSGQLLFVNYNCKTILKFNRLGIQEPILDVRNILPLQELEMIFTPLVACDKAGNRLGMGGGFYDRTLAQAPHLISVGLAHECQQVEQLPIESWDMPLDHIILGAAK
ncbi:TPA: 5-formyltetrahydrofolate cyclo-ligase [Mannheimia haemolytica]|uniref:5-formyltetrahydrofolate cyclo-ligase n=1 Tax=Mannheimia haemolytica TaxID=75985 RepID=UPI0010724A03|nr:5-formyltetrahydrofolate cyclo-ligase [Mannheimia haemolytica]MCB4226573.1 5-formyltetrahydrofolate cyclo-ligase [Mannheimia haemolytica]MEE3731639.1 5-formyltetrahydrofolate cyclo-ligase [Mannheimia haemolytica]